MSRKTLLVSLDCINADLLDGATSSGLLPTLCALRNRGSFARTRGLGLSAEGDWLSFYSGCEPAEHGHIAYDEIIPGTYRSRLTTESRSTQKPFYEMIAAAGARVLVLNPVHIGTQRLANGCMITNFQGHDTGHYFPLASFPPQLATALAERYPDDPVDPNDWGNSKLANPHRLLAGKQKTLQRKITVFRELLARDVWDLAYLGLDECHEMSHLFWHLHDPRHPQHDTANGFDPIVEMLTAVDAALGELLNLVPKDCLVVVVSIAGIAGNYHWSHLVDQLLTRFEGDGAATLSRYRSLRALWNKVPHTVQRPLNAIRHNVRETLLQRNRSRRRAFAIPLNEVSGGVRINLIGREPTGLVEPPDYAAVCRELQDKFESLSCVDTGKPLVRRIVHSAEVQHGRYLDRMPDLLIEWNTDQPIACVTSTYTGDIRRTFDDARTGHHINEGILLFSGGAEPARSVTQPVNIKDIGRALIARHTDNGSFGETYF